MEQYPSPHPKQKKENHNKNKPTNKLSQNENNQTKTQTKTTSTRIHKHNQTNSHQRQTTKAPTNLWALLSLVSAAGYVWTRHDMQKEFLDPYNYSKESQIL